MYICKTVCLWNITLHYFSWRFQRQFDVQGNPLSPTLARAFGIWRRHFWILGHSTSYLPGCSETFGKFSGKCSGKHPWQNHMKSSCKSASIAEWNPETLKIDSATVLLARFFQIFQQSYFNEITWYTCFQVYPGRSGDK